MKLNYNQFIVFVVKYNIIRFRLTIRCGRRRIVCNSLYSSACSCRRTRQAKRRQRDQRWWTCSRCGPYRRTTNLRDNRRETDILVVATATDLQRHQHSDWQHAYTIIQSSSSSFYLPQESQVYSNIMNANNNVAGCQKSIKTLIKLATYYITHNW